MDIAAKSGDDNYTWKDRMRGAEEKIKNLPSLLWQAFRGVAQDRRKVIHSLKVGLALTLVSLLFLLEPFFNGIGQNAIWAVMTVVVVLEFTAGATLCKGLNRGLGTLLAGSLGLLVESIAELTGEVFQAVFIAATVFLIGTIATYIRFIPQVKKNYDYGVLIFILTFNLITVSSYRTTNVLIMARDRFSTIAMGCGICLFITLLVYPIWSGDDLHKSTIRKFDDLAKSIEACVGEYFSDVDQNEATQQDDSSENLIHDIYRDVLDSKTQDETSALYARWEPMRLRRCRYPWQQYVNLGAALRRFGYTVVALHGCLQAEIPASRACHAHLKDPCIHLAGEVSMVLRELACCIQSRRRCSPEELSERLCKALEGLKAAIKSQPRLSLGSKSNNNRSLERPKEGAEEKLFRPQISKVASMSLELSEALPFAAFTFLLVETVARLENVIEEVKELGRIAWFRELKSSSADSSKNDSVHISCGTPKLNNVSTTTTTTTSRNPLPSMFVE